MTFVCWHICSFQFLFSFLLMSHHIFSFFFFNDRAPPEFSPLSLPDALPIPAADPALVERWAALAELPEMAGWFLDPEAVQADAVELLAARASRLVVSPARRGARPRRPAQIGRAHV